MNIFKNWALRQPESTLIGQDTVLSFVEPYFAAAKVFAITTQLMVFQGSHFALHEKMEGTMQMEGR